MIRLAEAYYYGVDVKQDYKTVLGWTQLYDEIYQNQVECYVNNPKLYFDKIGEKATNQYNLDLANQIKEHLTNDEIEQVKNNELNHIKSTIITWNYREWVDNATIPVQP